MKVSSFGVVTLLVSVAPSSFAQVPAAAPAPNPAEPAPPSSAPALDLSPRKAAAQIEALTVVGTRESRTPGAAHVIKSRDLERLDHDNPETVVKMVPGVYTRGEDGFGLRPNIGIRGTSPDRSKKITLMEDGVLFAPAAYSAPAAYYFPNVTRMSAVRVIKGPGAVSFGPHTVGGAIDLVTRAIPEAETGGIDLATGQYGFGKAHGYFGASGDRFGSLVEGLHLRSSGYKEIDGGGNSGFERNEWMWKGRYKLSSDPGARQELGLKLGYADEDSRESYLGLTDEEFRQNPNRRYSSSRSDRMRWHRTQIVATYHAEWQQAFTLDVAVYRQDFSRVWRKVNRLGGASIGTVLSDQQSPRNQIYRAVLAGEIDSSSRQETIYIGPNNRVFVAQGAQASAGWRGLTGPITHRAELGARLHYDRIDRLHTEDGFLTRGGMLVSDGRPTLTTAWARAWATALAIHATDAIGWGPLTLTPGLRAEFISTTVRDRLAGREDEGDPQRVLIPGMGAHVALGDHLGVLAGVHRGFSPAAPGRAGSAQPETSVNYEAGVRWSSAPLRAEVIGFLNDYQNLTSICTFAAGCSSDRVDSQSDAGRARIHGAEVFLSTPLRLGKNLSLPISAAYTYTKTEFLETFVSEDPSWGEVADGDELPYVPRHQAWLSAALESSLGTLAAGASYVSAMREEAGQGDAAPGVLTDESFVLDLTARAALGRRGEFYVHLRNALGAEDLASRRPFGARPIAPRWFQVGTKWWF
jgi:Fe(3+) dicitrate transport protein